MHAIQNNRYISSARYVISHSQRLFGDVVTNLCAFTKRACLSSIAHANLRITTHPVDKAVFWNKRPSTVFKCENIKEGAKWMIFDYANVVSGRHDLHCLILFVARPALGGECCLIW